MHNKFDQNWVRPFRVDVENMNFLYITLYITMWTLTPKHVTCFLKDSLDLFNFDSACPEVSKYLNRKALGVIVFGEEDDWSLT